MGWIVWLAVISGALLLLARAQLSFATWTLGLGTAGAILAWAGLLGPIPAAVLGSLWLLLMVPLNIPFLRQRLVSAPALRYIRKALPPMSETERTAIEAGGVWWEAELFGGTPDWSRLLDNPAPSLTEDELAFVDGPAEELCRMLDDWRITHELNDLPPEIWSFLKTNRFFGLIIPREYDGLGFSAFAHSEVVAKVSARSGTAAVTVMVPNSLGPAELLLHYGTEAQKDYYLPRLARGEEVPCFALTGPTAGSDAGSIPDYGIVCKGMHEGREVLGLRVSWEKRYITLAPVATVLGLAFKAFDPDHLLGEREDLGITCALVPTTTPGVEIGTRHYAMDAAFQNGPTRGRGVFIPMDWIIGGQDNIGRGWQMLMESLSAGRGISLPALGAGAGKIASRMTGAYARIRRQFNLPIGRFEGVEEALARIGGLTYMMDAARTLTTSAIDSGIKPAVVSAIMKYHNTEAMRQVINDAMDVHGGRGICIGPGNYLARGYGAIPITITVEGANILTRTMIIFGQGAMRCHPYLLREMEAASLDDGERALQAFDQALFGHLGYTITNVARTLVYSLTGGRAAPAPVNAEVSTYYRRLARISAAFALLADVAFLTLGGSLKRKEKLSGRFADVLSYMYLGSAVLKRYEDGGRSTEELALVHWAARHCLQQAESALAGIIANFPVRWLAGGLRVLVFPRGRTERGPDDRLGHHVAQILLEPSGLRDRLTAGIHISNDPDDPHGRMEVALRKVVAAEPVELRLHKAGYRPRRLGDQGWLDDALQAGVIDETEVQLVQEARAATADAIRVDEFPPAAEGVSRTADKAA